MSETNFDVVVIGSGPGGYVAAIRAAQLGLKTACVEKNPTLGGTCLNVGCIPSKALLQASEEYAHAGKALKRHGVMIENLQLDLPTMMGHKDKVVGDLTKGIAHLFQKNDITHIAGWGALGATGEVIVSDDGGAKTVLNAKATIIATGSASANLPGIEIDEKHIVSSTGALALSEVPGHLAVIGAGYIGLEMASVWGRLGAKITVIEFLDRIVPGMDGELATQFQKMLRRQKMKFKLSTKVTGAELTNSGVALAMEPVDGGAAETLEADVVLVAVGRKPYTEGLGLEQAGIATDGGGRIEVGDHFETNVACVYAIVVTRFIYRDITWRGLWQVSVNSMYLTAQVLLIVAAAGVFSWLLTVSGIPQSMVKTIDELNLQPWMILLAINVLLLVVGCLLDPNSAILILVPLLLPIVQAAGVDLIHFGIIMTVNLSIGMFTPPFGLNIFVAQALFKVPLKSIYPGLVPFISLNIVALMAVTYIPSLSLYLTRFVG